MTRLSFLQTFGDTLTGAPHLIARLWHLRPFESLEDMSEALWEIIYSLSHKERIALIRSHGWEDEGSEAGEEPGSFPALLAAYRKKFSFPFVFSGKDKEEAHESLRLRLNHDRAEEVATALTEVCEIARRNLEEKAAGLE